MRTPRHSIFPVTLVMAAALGSACEKEPPPKAVQVTDAGEALDPNLAKVLPASSGGPATATGEAGPPPSGVFAPGAADLEAKVGAAPAVKIGGQGGAPRVKLALGLVPGSKHKALLRLSLRTGPRSALPTLDVALAYGAGKAEAGPVPISVTFADVKLAPTQPGAISDELAKAIAKLKGSKITYSQAPNGGGFGFAYELSRGADPGLEQVVRSLAECIEGLALPAPTDDLGVGGIFMATHRSQYSGADVVTYRLAKVDKIEGDRISLTVNTKRYAASPKIDLAGAPAGQAIEIAEFRVEGETKIVVAAGDRLPASAETVETTIAAVKPAGQPAGPGQQVMTIQAEARAIFTLAAPAR